MSSVQPPAEGDLQQIIMELSQAAYHLAQQAAQQPNQFDQFAEQAYYLDRRLQTVALMIDNTEVPGQPDELIEAWTTARLDLDFILTRFPANQSPPAPIFDWSRLTTVRRCLESKPLT